MFTVHRRGCAGEGRCGRIALCQILNPPVGGSRNFRDLVGEAARKRAAVTHFKRIANVLRTDASAQLFWLEQLADFGAPSLAALCDNIANGGRSLTAHELRLLCLPKGTGLAIALLNVFQLDGGWRARLQFLDEDNASNRPCALMYLVTVGDGGHFQNVLLVGELCGRRYNSIDWKRARCWRRTGVACAVSSA